jgi:hypothetical protein
MANAPGKVTCIATFHVAADSDTPERCYLRGTVLPADHPVVVRFPNFFEALPDAVATAAPVERATRAPGEKRTTVKPRTQAAGE